MSGNLPPGVTQTDIDYAFGDDDYGYRDDGPYDDGPYDDEPSLDDCDHEEYEADINGRATCHRCGHSWNMSSEEIAAEHARIERFHEWEKRERRRERFRAIARWFRGFFPRWRKPVDLDDEIPF